MRSKPAAHPGHPLTGGFLVRPTPRPGPALIPALADAGNVAVAALLRNAGARLVHRGRGTVEYEITLASGPACGA